MLGPLGSYDEYEDSLGDDDIDTWEESSDSGTFSPCRQHSRQSSYGSSNINVSVRRSASGNPGDYAAHLGNVPVRRCMSGTGRDFSSANRMVGGVVRRTPSCTDSDFSSPPTSPLAYPVGAASASSAMQMQRDGVSTSSHSVGIAETEAESVCSGSNSETKTDDETAEHGENGIQFSVREQQQSTPCRQAVVNTVVKENQASQEDERGVMSCRVAGDGSSEDDTGITDQQPSSVAADFSSSSSQDSSQLKMGQDGQQGTRGFVAAVASAAAKSAAIHLSSCTREMPSLPVSDAMTVGRERRGSSTAVPDLPNPLTHASSCPVLDQASCNLTTSSQPNGGLLKTPLRRTDTPPAHQRKLKGPMMLNPSDLVMPTFPF
jgi:hypothetical protein